MVKREVMNVDLDQMKFLNSQNHSPETLNFDEVTNLDAQKVVEV